MKIWKTRVTGVAFKWKEINKIYVEELCFRALIRQFKENGSDASVRLVVDHLQETDHGQYLCVDKNGNKEDSSVTVNLIIKSIKIRELSSFR